MSGSVASSSKSKKTWEESFYWDKLRPSFKVDLSGDFLFSLEIPQYFVENVKGKLPEQIELRGPQPPETAAVWRVQLKHRNERCLLYGEEWTKFVSAFTLQDSDTLTFEYIDNSFNVIVYSGETCCEKGSSYFVKRTLVDEVEDYRGSEKTSERKNNRGNMNLGGVSGERYVHLDISDHSDESLSGMSGARTSKEENIRCAKQKALDDIAHTERFPKRNQSEKVASPKDIRRILFPQKRGHDDDYTGCTKKRIRSDEGKPQWSWEPTTDAKDRAKQRARCIQKSTKNSFMVVMARTFVSGSCRMGIPKSWWREFINLERETYLKIRRRGEIQFGTQMYTCYYDKSKSSVSIRAGWKTFVEKNSLREHDCCVFTLAKPWKETDDLIFMEVEIIRAIRRHINRDYRPNRSK